jgi:hypothetical protein
MVRTAHGRLLPGLPSSVGDVDRPDPDPRRRTGRLDPGGTLSRDARPDSAPIALHVYPDAHHAFDVAVLQPGRRAFGHSVEYNEPAAKDAEEKTRAFLAAHLAGPSPAAGNRR